MQYLKKKSITVIIFTVTKNYKQTYTYDFLYKTKSKIQIIHNPNITKILDPKIKIHNHENQNTPRCLFS